MKTVGLEQGSTLVILDSVDREHLVGLLVATLDGSRPASNPDITRSRRMLRVLAPNHRALHPLTRTR